MIMKMAYPLPLRIRRVAKVNKVNLNSFKNPSAFDRLQWSFSIGGTVAKADLAAID